MDIIKEAVNYYYHIILWVFITAYSMVFGCVIFHAGVELRHMVAVVISSGILLIIQTIKLYNSYVEYDDEEELE